MKGPFNARGLGFVAFGLGLSLSLLAPAANAEIVRRTSTSTLRTTGSSVTRSVRDETGTSAFQKEVRDVTQFQDGSCTTNCTSANQMSEIRQVESSSSQWTQYTVRDINLGIDLRDVTETLYLGTEQLGQP